MTHKQVIYTYKKAINQRNVSIGKKRRNSRAIIKLVKK